jgi:tetratricopeptide (TPR) repeat protein
MTKKNTPAKTERAFLSKEINFLKFDSEPEKQNDLIPDEYLSDRIRSQEPWMKDFTDRLETMDIPENTFICAVVSLPDKVPPDQALPDKALKNLPDLDPHRGMVQRIDHRYIVITVWDKDHLDPILCRIQEDCCSGAQAHPIVGTALFPFMDFSRKETFYNAVRAVDHAAFLGPGSKVTFSDISLNISGDRLYQLGFMDEAALEYQRGITINPENTNLMNSLGVCHAMNNDPEQAKKIFETALLKDPIEVMAAYNLGLVCSILEQEEQALFHLEKASGLDSSIFEIELTTGRLHLKKGRLDDALPHLDRAKKLNTCAGLPYRLLGDYYLETGKIDCTTADNAATPINTPINTPIGKPIARSIDQSIVEFKQAIKLNPMDAVSLSGLAHAFYLTDKNLQIAITLAQESIRIDPDTPIFYSRLGDLYLKTGQEELARMAFDMAEKTPEAKNSLFQKTLKLTRQTLGLTRKEPMDQTQNTRKKRIA